MNSLPIPNKVGGPSATPPSRRSAATAVYRDKIYVFGGISHYLLNDLHLFDIHKLAWNSEEQKDNDEESITRGEDEQDNAQFAIDMQGRFINSVPDPRFGHSVVRYKDTLILYGGEENFDTERKKRKLFNDIYYYHIHAKLWEQVPWREKVVYGRKYHAAVMIGQNMLVHGGIKPSNNVIDEMILFNITNNKWTDVQNVSNSPGQLAGHKLVLILENERLPYESSLSLRSLPKLTSIKRVIKNEGIYCFGGINDEGVCNNDLQFLNLNSNRLEWKFVETKGSQPHPRYLHSMDYLESLVSLVIFGGRKNKPSDKDTYYFNDLWIFHIPTSHWGNVKIFGDVPEERYSHASGISGSSIMIFGGNNEQGICNRET
jgi:hypothetical protein